MTSLKRSISKSTLPVKFYWAHPDVRNSVFAKFGTLRIPSPTRSPCEIFTRCNQRQKKYYTKPQTDVAAWEREITTSPLSLRVMQHAELESSAQSLVGFAAGAKRRARITISLCQRWLCGDNVKCATWCSPGLDSGSPPRPYSRPAATRVSVRPGSTHPERRTKGLVTLLCARQPLFTIGESRSCCWLQCWWEPASQPASERATLEKSALTHSARRLRRQLQQHCLCALMPACLLSNPRSQAHFHAGSKRTSATNRSTWFRSPWVPPLDQIFCPRGAGGPNDRILAKFGWN